MTTDGQPDWDKIAEKFDLWLPQFRPVNDALIQSLRLRSGDKVLDVACGTGEPALSIADMYKDNVQVVATDAAAGMIRTVNKKIEERGLNNIRTKVVAAEALDYPDAEFDKLVCRFGVMLFEDIAAGLKQMARVLRPEGGFAFAVWSIPETMPNIYWSYLALKDRVAKELHPPLFKATCLCDAAVFEDLLRQAGFRSVRIGSRTFNYYFKNFEDYWKTLMDSEILAKQLDVLDEQERENVKQEIAMFAGEFQTDQGLIIPHEFLLAEGSK